MELPVDLDLVGDPARHPGRLHELLIDLKQSRRSVCRPEWGARKTHHLDRNFPPERVRVPANGPVHDAEAPAAENLAEIIFLSTINGSPASPGAERRPAPFRFETRYGGPGGLPPRFAAETPSCGSLRALSCDPQDRDCRGPACLLPS